jgi:hypothetical protein
LDVAVHGTVSLLPSAHAARQAKRVSPPRQYDPDEHAVHTRLVLFVHAVVWYVPSPHGAVHWALAVLPRQKRSAPHGWHSRLASSLHAVVSNEPEGHRGVHAAQLRLVTFVQGVVWYSSPAHRARHV